VEQTARSLTGIEISFVWLPAMAYGLAIVPVLFYHRYERLEPQIRRELDERRKLAALMSSSV
jgi:Na+/melibiose symporter-like transporter